MEYRLEIFSEAEEAINEEVGKLERNRAGRGSDLLVAIDDALDFIIQFPRGSAIRYKTFRAKAINGFPYLLIYEVVESEHSDFHLIAIADFVHQSSNWLPGN